MIRDLSLTLKAVLTQPGLPAELQAALISFDRPSEPYGPSETTVNLFLFDIHENVDLRDNEPVIERSNTHVTLRRPPLRVTCRYLITAWPSGGEEPMLQEHRLLSQTLQVLSRYPTIPRALLQGSLASQTSLPMMVARADGLQNPAEFWTALGNRLKPSLSAEVTIAMETLAPEVLPMVITEEVRLGERTSDEEEVIKPGTLERAFRIGGRVTDASSAPVPGATVILVERGVTVTTDETGYYRIGFIPGGLYTLRVQKEALEVTKGITVPAPAGSHYNVQLGS